MNNGYLYTIWQTKPIINIKIDILEDRINEAIEYIKTHDLYYQDEDYDYEENIILGNATDEEARRDLLNILEGKDENMHNVERCSCGSLKIDGVCENCKKRDYNIDISYVDIEEDIIFIGWTADVGFGVLTIIKTVDGFKIETECMGEEFYRQVLDKAKEFIFDFSEIIE